MSSFIDDKGTEWMVTEVVQPSPRMIPTELLRQPEYKSGWLLFHSTSHKRRLAPYPENWRELSPLELEMLCRRARPAFTVTRDVTVDRRSTAGPRSS
jgi:hypothetical protein